MRCSLLCLAIPSALGAISVFSPSDWDTVALTVEHGGESLPRGLAPGETPVSPRAASSGNASLPAGFSLVAEFAPMAGVLIRYPLGIPASLVALFATDVHVYCLCEAVLQPAAMLLEHVASGVLQGAVVAARQREEVHKSFNPWVTGKQPVEDIDEHQGLERVARTAR